MNIDSILKFYPQLNDLAIDRFEKLMPIYTEWNAKINVISRKDIDQFYPRHVLHSLSIDLLHNIPEGAKVLDFGTGGGFPGVPLAILRPDVEFLLVDSIGKKLRVIEAAVAALQLKNVTTKHCRVETIQGQYQFITSRAVSRLSNLMQWTQKLHRKDTVMLCLKGGSVIHEEIAEVECRIELDNLHTLFGGEMFEEKYLLKAYPKIKPTMDMVFDVE